MICDVTMTATWRPEILERTFKSFFKNLWTPKDPELKLIINIDPVGSSKDKSGDIIEICSNYFREVQINRPEKAHFPSAIQWTWTQTKAPFVFNLEEDWELLYFMNWNNMLQCFIQNPKLVHLRFSKFKSTLLTCKNWSFFFNWNGGYFQCPDKDKGTVGWCGHPSLNRGNFIRECLPHINFDKNPEKQIKSHNTKIKALIDKSDFGCYIPQNSPPNIRDIGREWMLINGFRKKGKNKEWFTEWEKSSLS
jgi:hypothetical protein